MRFADPPRIDPLESLASFLEGVPASRIPPYNPHPTPFLAVRDAVHRINDASATGSDVSAYYQMLESRAKVPIKFLKFKEDTRPGYVGAAFPVPPLVFSAPALTSRFAR